MSQPYVGEVRIVGFNFAPAGWQTCSGQLLPISEFETLFNLIGTTYGGDGQTTFALPDLRGRVALHQGTLPGASSFVLGQAAGTETVTVTTQQIPAHSHGFLASAAATGQVSTIANNTLSNGVEIYATKSPSTPMANGVLSSVGGSQPHENMQPFLVLNWIISPFGVFPSQS